MNSIKREAIKRVITKALIVRGECCRFSNKLIILAICYSNDDDTPMCVPKDCYHTFCRECLASSPNKYIISK